MSWPRNEKQPWPMHSQKSSPNLGLSSIGLEAALLLFGPFNCLKTIPSSMRDSDRNCKQTGRPASVHL